MTTNESSESKSNQQNQKSTEEVNILLIMRDKHFEILLTLQLNQFCNLTIANSLNDASNQFELSKSSLDFIIIASCLEDSTVDTIELSEKFRKDSKFTGKLIAIGRERIKLLGDNKCQFVCTAEDLPTFILPKIKEVMEEKKLLSSKKKELKEEKEMNASIEKLKEKFNYKVN